ncbi:hypothetical protein EI94DRAFT_1788794 [Lactarius quietus]|nr:hypothetical protein EI94DRAFT_1788794 [Lactarius quietus]
MTTVQPKGTIANISSAQCPAYGTPSSGTLAQTFNGPLRPLSNLKNVLKYEAMGLQCPRKQARQAVTLASGLSPILGAVAYRRKVSVPVGESSPIRISPALMENWTAVILCTAGRPPKKSWSDYRGREEKPPKMGEDLYGIWDAGCRRLNVMAMGQRKGRRLHLLGDERRALSGSKVPTYTAQCRIHSRSQPENRICDPHPCDPNLNKHGNADQSPIVLPSPSKFSTNSRWGPERIQDEDRK